VAALLAPDILHLLDEHPEASPPRQRRFTLQISQM
jgi:hypothetical protein